MTPAINNEKQNEETINFITNDINKKFSKNECVDTGKVWKRNCPKCGKELVYINKRSFNQICKNNSLCNSCCQEGKGHPHTEFHKKYMKFIMIGRKITNEWKLKIKNSHWSKNPILKKEILEKHSKLMTERIFSGKYNHKNKNFKSGYYLNNTTKNNEFYRSSYELRKMKELNENVNVKMWTTKHRIRIPYYINNIRHFYIPDFLIEMVDGKKFIEETKGYIEDKNVFDIKSLAAKKYCKEKRMVYKISYDKDIKN